MTAEPFLEQLRLVLKHAQAMPSPEAVHKHAATLKQLVIDVYQDQVTDQLYYDETSLRKLTAGMRAMRQLALAVPAYYFRPNDISCQLTSAGWLESALYKHVVNTVSASTVIVS